MTIEVPIPITETSYTPELAKSVIYEEIMHTEGYLSLSPGQLAWFEKYAAPLLVEEGFRTGDAVAREVADSCETREERLSREADIFVKGVEEYRNYIGRN